MTRYSVFIIQTNGKNIICEASGKQKNGKWAGLINLYKQGFFHTMLASSEPIYNSSKEAIIAMKKIVKEICSLDLKTV